MVVQLREVQNTVRTQDQEAHRSWEVGVGGPWLPLAAGTVIIHLLSEDRSSISEGQKPEMVLWG